MLLEGNLSFRLKWVRGVDAWEAEMRFLGT